MTTLKEIEDSLPNGVHDARLEGLAMRCETGELALEVRLAGSGPHTRARITLAGVHSAHFDVPGDLLAALGDSRSRRMDAGPGFPAQARIAPPVVPADHFQHWFFVEGWNGFSWWSRATRRSSGSSSASASLCGSLRFVERGALGLATVSAEHGAQRRARGAGPMPLGCPRLARQT